MARLDAAQPGEAMTLVVETRAGKIVITADAVLAAWWVPRKGLQFVRRLHDDRIGEDWLGHFVLKQTGADEWTDELTASEIYPSGGYVAVESEVYGRGRGGTFVSVIETGQVARAPRSMVELTGMTFREVAWSHGTEHLAVSGRGELWLWSPEGTGFEKLVSWDVPGLRDFGPRSLDWSPDDHWLATGVRVRREYPPADRERLSDEEFLAAEMAASYVEVAVVDLRTREVAGRASLPGPVRVLEWDTASTALRLVVSDLSALGRYFHFTLDPVTGRLDQMS